MTDTRTDRRQRSYKTKRHVTQIGQGRDPEYLENG